MNCLSVIDVRNKKPEMINLQDPVLDSELHALRAGLQRHPLFAAIREPADLRQFMQVHVFAVWDFMSLAKRLQRDLTALSLPWLPPTNAEAARLINEIILAEESDVGPDGEAASHLDLYLGAMAEVGADTAPFSQFIAAQQRGVHWSQALESPAIPAVARDFVRSTLNTAINGSTLQTMASFFYGRESIIPEMFQGLLDHWGLSAESAPRFVYYLRRHIQLDAEAHGPAAARLLSAIAGEQSDALLSARAAAREALSARHQLWDGTLLALRVPSVSSRAPTRPVAYA
ncbi:DUF3050 domain-containing protein [Candidatus Thiodictyon syntrophicum]|nr:DUF3050 domain-containing protein [Candidatus Thiodictyon syntrophicum]